MNDCKQDKKCSIFKDERALGFVESLIAIFISGIACVALMSVAVRVIRESKASELRDASNQYALEGLEMVRTIAATNPTEVKKRCPSVGVKKCALNSTHTKLAEIPIDSACSEYEKDGTVCEKLDWGPSDDFFYREIDIQKSGSCDLVKVRVRVGTIIPNNNFTKEAEVTGYVPL